MGLNWAALCYLTWRSRRHCAARPRSRRSCEAEQGWWRSSREGRPEPQPDSRYRRWPPWWPSPRGGASADGWWPCTCRSEVSGLTILTLEGKRDLAACLKEPEVLNFDNSQLLIQSVKCLNASTQQLHIFSGQQKRCCISNSVALNLAVSVGRSGVSAWINW